jgi:hypothetical protein
MYDPSIASIRSCLPTIIGIFLYTVYFYGKQSMIGTRGKKKKVIKLTLYAAVKSCEVLKSRSDASDMRLKIDAEKTTGHDQKTEELACMRIR